MFSLFIRKLECTKGINFAGIEGAIDFASVKILYAMYMLECTFKKALLR